MDINGGVLAGWVNYSTGEPTGGTMRRGDRLYSSNGGFYVEMQTDGNFVIYEGQGNWSGWAVSNFYDQYYLINKVTMQSDGNLVWQTYDGVPLLASNTQGDWAATLVMQDDRNLVIYKSDNSGWVWSSGSQV